MHIIELTTYRTALQPNVCLLALRTDTGLVGLGESFWGAPAVEAYLHETAAPILAALPSAAPVAAAAALRPYAGFGGSGAEIRGNGAIDIALWDLLGQVSGRPVASLLGGPLTSVMRVYNTCAGYAYVGSEGRQSSANWGLPGNPAAARPYEDLGGFLHHPAALARSLMDEGYTAMKVWPFDMAAERSRGQDITTAELRSAMGILEAIRGEAGEAMEILVELHSNWSLKAAVKILTALEEIRPFWVEDPIRTDAVDAYRRLRERVRVPIAAGEALGSARAFKPLLEAGALDVAIVDPGWVGGITEAVRVASMADTYGVSFAPHDCTGPVSFAVCVQLACSQPNTVISESVRAFLSDWYPEVVDGLPEVRGGSVHLSETPGLGITLRESFVARPDTTTRTTRFPA